MNTSPGRRTGWIFAVVVVLGAAAGGVAYLGIRDDGPPAAVSSAGPESVSVAGSAIELPHEEPIVPTGPHRERFQSSCTVCHSTRLVFTQPALTEKQWTEVVAKMVNAYGAPLTPEQQGQVVSYLTALRDDPTPLGAAKR